jgi:hypothetical protein
VRHTWIGLILNGKRPERKPMAEAEPVVVIATRVPFPEVEYPPAPARVPEPTCGKRSERVPAPRRRSHTRSGEHAPLPAR